MVSRHRILLDSHALVISDFWTWIAAISKDDAEAFARFDVSEWDLEAGALVPTMVGMPKGHKAADGMTWPDRTMMVELIAKMTAIPSRRWRVDEQRVLPVDASWIE